MSRVLRPVTEAELHGARTPCESCGTPLLLVDLLDAEDYRLIRRTWWEGTGDWREHDASRCTAARAALR